MKTLKHRPWAERGISLIEIMVSMAIGLVVVGAVLSTYLHSRAGSRQSTGLTQVTEDASLAFGILRAYVSMAGYSEPTGVDGFGMTRRLTGPAIIGCDGGITSGEKAVDPKAVTCQANGIGPDSLIVRYQADGRNSPITAGTNAPMDCQGVGLVQGAPPNDYFVSDSRFSIAADTATNAALALKCLGSGTTPTMNATATAAATTLLDDAAVTLVDNIQDLQISYGLASLVSVTPSDGGAAAYKPGKRASTYLSAKDIGVPASPNWDRVVSVHLCMVVRSEAEVLSNITPYRGCTNAANPNPDITALITPTDRRIYRAFTTTIVLNNRI